jgi:THAP domain-containing protein 4
MHPALGPLKFLIGTWKSTSAKGHFPNIKDFNYEETIEFESIGQPLLNFKSTSKIGERPMHLESGFLKLVPGTSDVTFLVSHNFGICTIEEGNVDGNKITLKSKEIVRCSTAKDPNVTRIERMIQLKDGKLEILTDMATTRVPELTNHLMVVYEKISIE